MKILYIHQYFYTPEIGGGTRSYEFARRFVEWGHEVTLLTKQFDESSPIEKGNIRKNIIDGINVIEFPVNYRGKMSFIERVKSFLSFAFKSSVTKLEIEKPDIIFATSTPLTVGIPALVLSWKYKIPFVFEVRDLWPDLPIEMGYINNFVLKYMLYKFEKYIYKKAKHIVALSPGMKEEIINKGISSEKIDIVPNSSDNNLFGNKKWENNDIRNRFNLGDSHLFVYAGALGEAQGLEILVDCAKKLKNRQDIKIIIVGRGKCKSNLIKKANKYNLSNIVFLSKKSKYDIAKLYSEATAGFVLLKNLPLLSTSCPNKFFDILAAGKPVINNVDGWLTKKIEENKAGISIESNNEDEAEKLSRALKYLVDNKETAHKMGKNARELAENEFDRDYLAKKLLCLLTNI